MCSYCGCQAITIVGRFTAEHEAIINATGHLRRAAIAGDPPLTLAAAQALAALELLLRRHIDKEENGLFPAAAIALDGPAWERVMERAG